MSCQAVKILLQYQTSGPSWPTVQQPPAAINSDKVTEFKDVKLRFLNKTGVYCRNDGLGSSPFPPWLVEPSEGQRSDRARAEVCVDSGSVWALEP